MGLIWDSSKRIILAWPKFTQTVPEFTSGIVLARVAPIFHIICNKLSILVSCNCRCIIGEEAVILCAVFGLVNVLVLDSMIIFNWCWKDLYAFSAPSPKTSTPGSAPWTKASSTWETRLISRSNTNKKQRLAWIHTTNFSGVRDGMLNTLEYKSNWQKNLATTILTYSSEPRALSLLNS